MATELPSTSPSSPKVTPSKENSSLRLKNGTSLNYKVIKYFKLPAGLLLKKKKSLKPNSLFGFSSFKFIRSLPVTQPLKSNKRSGSPEPTQKPISGGTWGPSPEGAPVELPLSRSWVKALPPVGLDARASDAPALGAATSTAVTPISTPLVKMLTSLLEQQQHFDLFSFRHHFD